MRIRPLAPLSMVADIPGSYYKTLMSPSKKMLCGLFENILGWHFDKDTRDNIIKKLGKKRKNYFRDLIEGSTYQPLLSEYFDIGDQPIVENLRTICRYNDYWSRSYKRSDSHLHINGTRFMDAGTIAQMLHTFSIIDNKEEKASEKNAEKDSWFKLHIGKFPQYYTSPTNREYVDIDAELVYSMTMDTRLFTMLNVACENNNIGYLGDNEGWIHLSINKK